jgi:hypothetical protein
LTSKVVLEVASGKTIDTKDTVPPINTRSEHVTISRAGIQSSGLFPGLRIEEELLRRGDLVVVNSVPQGKFDAECIALALVPYFSSYGSITFDAWSMGVPVLHEAMRLARKLEVAARLTMVLRDPIATVHDLKPLMRAGGSIAPLLSGKKLPGWIGEKILFVDTYPDGEQLTDEEATEQREHVKRSREYSPGYFFSEYEWLRRFPGPRAESLQGIESVALKSMHDKLLRDSAIESWKIAFGLNGYILPVLPVDGKAHCDAFHSPHVWTARTADAYDKLGIHPLY